MGAVTHICTQTDLQALDYALKLNGLAPEGIVSAVASSRSHHLGPPVPQHRVSCKKRNGNKEDGEGDSSICMGNFQIAVLLLTRQPLWRLTHTYCTHAHIQYRFRVWNRVKKTFV